MCFKSQNAFTTAEEDRKVDEEGFEMKNKRNEKKKKKKKEEETEEKGKEIQQQENLKFI